MGDEQLEVGARLPSARDLAVQLGVARNCAGAYDALVAELLLSTAGSGGTRVIARAPSRATAPDTPIDRPLATMLVADRRLCLTIAQWGAVK